MTQNAYSVEEEKQLMDLYCNQGLKPQEIERITGKSYRSVISKLVVMDLYEKPQRTNRPTVQEMVKELEELLSVEFQTEIDDSINLGKKYNVKTLLHKVKESLENGSNKR